MKYDIVLVIEDLFGLNPSEAKGKALELINSGKIEKSDLQALCHQVGGRRKRV